jgi:ankyrin repeat protein
MRAIDTPPVADTESILHKVARLGDSNIPLAIAHIERGVDPNSRDYLGRTPLMFAARHNSVAVLKLLLKSGADPTLSTSDGTTALDIAQASRNTKCADILSAR